MEAAAIALYEEMKKDLGKIVPDVELYYKAEIAIEIQRLKQERNAVILGHNCMGPVLFHSIPDFKGDSLDLSRKAAQTDKDVIVFWAARGVRIVASPGQMQLKQPFDKSIGSPIHTFRAMSTRTP